MIRIGNFATRVTVLGMKAEKMSGISGVTTAARYCAVKSCFNNSFSCILSFFRFPKDTERCKEWIQLSGRDDFINQDSEFLNKNYFICSDHFGADQFINKEVRDELILNAVPNSVKNRNIVVTSICLPENMNINAGKLNPVVVLKDCTKLVKRKLNNDDECLNSKPCPKSKILRKSAVVDKETRNITTKKMPNETCAAVSCSNSKGKCKNLCFFSFPRDFERCMTWAKNSGRDDLMNKSPDELNKSAILCATHFDSEHFFNPPNKKRLRWDAIPTVFKTSNTRTTSPITPKQLKGLATASRPQTNAKNTSERSTIAVVNTETNTVKKKSVKEIAKPTTESSLQSISKYLPDSTVSLLKIHFLRMRKNVVWTRNGKRLAVILYIHFPNRYRALNKLFGLPSINTLEKWLRNEQFFPGIQTNHIRMLHDTDVFERCKDNAKKFEKKSAVLVMRRLKLKPSLSYDMKLDRIDGLQDLNYNGKARYTATHSIVFTVKGLITKWRLPVGYFPVSKRISIPLIAKLLFETLVQLESTGLQVRVLVLAYNAHAQQLMDYFAVSLARPFIFFMGHRILVVYDPPGLLKRLFYSFKKSDIHFGGTNVASWNHVEKFYAVDTAQKLPIVPEITVNHIEAVNYHEVTTKMAAQIFDLKTAASISYGNYLGDKNEDAASTAIFLKMIAELYSLFCGKLPDEKLAYPKQLTQLLAKMKNFYHVKGPEPKPWSQAWNLSISSLGQLWHDMNVETRKKLNSKILRLKDAQMIKLMKKLIGKNKYPTSNSVRQLMRELSVSTLMKPKKLKCLKLEAVFFPKVVQRLSAQSKVIENKMAPAVPKLPDKLEEFPRENGLSIVAGFIVLNVFERHKCDICGENWAQKCSLAKGATELFVLWLEKTKAISFTDYVILAPSERLMELVFRFEDFFSNNFCKIVHMDRPALRLATALRRHFKSELKDMCGPIKKAFLKLFVQCEIVRCISVYNSKTRKKNKILNRSVFRL